MNPKPELTTTQVDEAPKTIERATIQFVSPQGEEVGGQLELDVGSTTEQLTELINTVLQNEEPFPYSFYFKEEEIVSSLVETLTKKGGKTEELLHIVYQPQAVFRVRAVSRCTDTVAGHTEAVLHVSFSPDGNNLASGSGDSTVRIWDVLTATPKSTLKGHKSWVMAVGFSPDAKTIASGGMEGNVILWDVETGQQKGRTMTGHKKWITGLAWEPACTAQGPPRLASSSKDGDVRIWDTVRNCLLLTLAGHTNAVKCVKWGSENLIYSASADRSVKVWEATHGKLVRTLDGHAHWVNTLSLNTEYALRTGPYDHNGNSPEEEKAKITACQEKLKKVTQNAGGRELLVSGSDDFTLFLWQPTKDKKPILRLTGHQQPVNFVQYSPDGSLIASASFDNSVRIWNGITGNFIAVFRGHVQSVYQVCWSGDSRLLCSSSKDSTMKVWDIRTRKLKFDLPGHSDEVFAVDWAPNGQRVASGGKDKVLKLWQA